MLNRPKNADDDQPAYDPSRSSSGTSNYVRSSYVEDDGSPQDSEEKPKEEKAEKVKDDLSVPRVG